MEMVALDGEVDEAKAKALLALGECTPYPDKQRLAA
jgi:hypothetical protein